MKSALYGFILVIARTMVRTRKSSLKTNVLHLMALILDVIFDSIRFKGFSFLTREIKTECFVLKAQCNFICTAKNIAVFFMCFCCCFFFPQKEGIPLLVRFI